MFIPEHDKQANKQDKQDQPMPEIKKNGILLCLYQHTFECDNKMIHCRYILLNIRELQILYVIPVGSTLTEKYFSDIRQIENRWTIISMHSNTIFVSKTDLCNAYMSIHARRMMTSSLFIDS